MGTQCPVKSSPPSPRFRQNPGSQQQLTVVVHQHFSSRLGSGFVSHVREQKRMEVDCDGESVQIRQACKALDIRSRYPVDPYFKIRQKNQGYGRGDHLRQRLFLPQLSSGYSCLPNRATAWLGQRQQLNWSLCCPGDKGAQRELRGWTVCDSLRLLERTVQGS